MFQNWFDWFQWIAADRVFSLPWFSISHHASLQEIHSKQKSGVVEDSPRRGPESLPVGHHDIITDIATFQTTQGFIVTSSRDGIVKVWK